MSGCESAEEAKIIMRADAEAQVSTGAQPRKSKQLPLHQIHTIEMTGERTRYGTYRG
jgi:hypothetical protein